MTQPHATETDDAHARTEAAGAGGYDEVDTDSSAGDGEPSAVTELILPDAAALEAERDEYLRALQQVKADFDNFRKRVVRQQDEQSARAARDLVGKLLPVLDTLDLAEAHLATMKEDEEVRPEVQALSQARAQLIDVLVKEGLQRVDEIDVTFDPEVHDAVAHAPADASAGSDALIDEVLRSGYRWRGQVLRPAMVRVLEGDMAPQREWFEKDFYKTLGVSSTATDKEITRAYRKLAKQYHPDANPGSEERFKEISAAYDVLGDEKQRKEYDEVRRLGPMAGGFGTPGGGAGGGTFRMEDMGDLGDLFGGLFGGRGGRRRPRGPRRGADMEAELHLSFEDAVHGVTTSVAVPHDVRCHTCNGTGAAPGTDVHTCPRCNGKGTLDDNQGLFSLSTICPRCNGRGTVVDTPCPTCAGTGTERHTRNVKVRIPPGVEDGQRIRVKGRGEPGQGMAPAGDLYVVVRVSKHALFGRRGRNLTLTVPVTFPEATLGTTVTVPTLDDPVTVRVPAGTAPGTTLRIRGRGVSAGTGKNGTKPGDLLVKVDVVVPTSLSDEQRAAVESLADVTPAAPREYLGV